jgi:hypothetical protein
MTFTSSPPPCNQSTRLILTICKNFTVTYLNSGGKIGDTIRAEVTCDKCTLYSCMPFSSFPQISSPSSRLFLPTYFTLTFSLSAHQSGKR